MVGDMELGTLSSYYLHDTDADGVKFSCKYRIAGQGHELLTGVFHRFFIRKRILMIWVPSMQSVRLSREY